MLFAGHTVFAWDHHGNLKPLDCREVPGPFALTTRRRFLMKVECIGKRGWWRRMWCTVGPA